MSTDTILLILDHIGILAFAISGFLTAADKKLDLFGAFIIGLVTALGGGTLRDLLLNTDIAWVSNVNYIYVGLAGGLAAWLFRTFISRLRKTLFIFDTVGIGLFTVFGLEKALSFQVDPTIAVMLAVITASFGGVIRDTLCNEIPLLFRQEIYGTACLAGAFCYLLLLNMGVPPRTNLLISGSLIIGVRVLAVKFKLALPIVNARMKKS